MGSLYRKYRSRSLSEIVGQQHITELLARNIAAGAISHAYLLTGPHGVGKTSIARILAHEINGLPYDDDANHLDIIEIDAASNNGVEDIRELRERVHVAPAHAAKKVYIIDEVHMLSKSAFNALLKTLEEPPEHVVFILATTEADKLPSTIISRVQRFNFRSISLDDIVNHLRYIADSEKISIDDTALRRVAEYGQGSFRDSIGVLDQLRHAAPSDRPIAVTDVENVLGITSEDTIEALLRAARQGDLAILTAQISQLETSGIQASLIARQLIRRIQTEITSHPGEIALLDALLDVPASNYPYLKLLTVLASDSYSAGGAEAVSTDKTSTIGNTAPLVTSSPEGSAFPAEVGTRKMVTSGPTVPDGDDGSEGRGDKITTIAPAPAKASPQLIADFSWPDFVASAKEHSGALHALLMKTGEDFDGEILTLYAGTAFAAKKLETAKLRPILSEIALSQGIDGDKIVISPTKKPPTDSQAADVAAIMGGGEEVDINGN